MKIPALAFARALLVVAGLAFCGPVLAQKSGDNPEKFRRDPISETSPMLFYVAKGGPNACGEGCDAWIAAEGTFDIGSSSRFREFLYRRGDRKLPVYFHSPGGFLDQAMQIGRLMRLRKITAGIGRTIPDGCDPSKLKDERCDLLKRSELELPGELRSANTLCNSACVYALIGAETRDVPPGSRIGVHTGKVERYRYGYDRKPEPGPPERLKQYSTTLRRYIRDMGVDEALQDAVEEIANERIRYLSRDEIARFRIDPRPFQESRWMIDEGPPFSIVKFVTEAKGTDRKEYRTSLIQIGCRSKDALIMQYSRELGANETPGGRLKLVSGGQTLSLDLPANRPVSGYNNITMLDRTVRVPSAFFKSAAAADKIEFAEGAVAVVAGWELPQDGKPASVMTLSTAGLSGALDKLLERCR